MEITASQTGDDAARRQSIVPTLVIGHDKLDHHNVSVVVGVFNRLSGITR